MIKFLKHIFAFFGPVVLIALGITYFYIQVKDSGELSSLNESILYQRENENCLFGMGYYDNAPYYKLTNVNYYKPPIIALGTSRVMQFKEDFFSLGFYNCGGAVFGNYNEYLNFLLNMSYTPDCIILGLDAWVFNDAWNTEMPNYDTFVSINEGSIEQRAILKSAFDDWMARKWKFKDLQNYPQNIGFNGKVKDSGFMNDGSYYYGHIYKNPMQQEDYAFVDTKERIQTGTSRFEYGTTIDDDTITQLQNLLTYCKENNIYVIGFSAPLAPSIYDELILSGNYEYLNDITPTCEKLFKSYGYEYYDFLDVRRFGVTDDFFIDGFHGSEVVYGYMMLEMALDNPQICSYTDTTTLKNILQSAYNGLVFNNPYDRFQ